MGRVLSRLFVVGTLGIFSLLSISRVVSNVLNFGAPLRVYQHLYAQVLLNPETSMLVEGTTAATFTENLCIMKEWYRFPTSFFIPTNRSKVQFVKSSFAGLLPKPFEEHENGTSIIPSAMNDRNREEASRYVSIEVCDYIVDLNLPNQKEVKLWEEPAKWELVYSEPFLDTERSKSPYRSFYIPMLTPQHVHYVDYAIYKRKQAAANREPRTSV